MKYQKISFTESIAPHQSKIGGLPLLEEQSDWPIDPESGTLLLLLLTIDHDLLGGLFPETVIPDNCCISVFICFDSSSRRCIRRLAIHEQSEINKIGNGSSKVILHKRSLKPSEPPIGSPSIISEIGLALSPIDEEEPDQELADRGTIFSKLGGIPGWAQDPIDIPEHKYILQLSESEFWQRSPEHSGILGSDTGFLFLKNPLKIGEVGTFFIQFS